MDANAGPAQAGSRRPRRGTTSRASTVRLASQPLTTLLLASGLLVLGLHTTGSPNWAAAADADTDALEESSSRATSTDSDSDYAPPDKDDDDDEDDDAPSSPTTTTTTAAPAGVEEVEPPKWLRALMEPKPKGLAANPNSGVEKGSKSELPKPTKDPETGESRAQKPPNRLGVVEHSDDPKTKAESPPTSTSTTSTTSAPKKQGDGDDGGDDDEEEEEDEEGDSRAARPVSKPSPAPQGPNVTSVGKSIEKLGQQSEHLTEKKNTSIIINGRKFDQVESIECVDDKFYDILMKDLSLVAPDRKQDFYGTYYDPDYAKAIGALIETPSPSGQNGQQADAYKSEAKLRVKDILAEVRALWNETMATYTSRRSQLDMNNLPLGRASSPGNDSQPAPVFSFMEQPRHQAALANYRYLLDRLERLKLLLLSGEEALIVMNNKVRKLNQAVGETELASALCSCITSRSGRAAFSLMNELFVDKNSAQLMQKIDEAKRRGDEAAVDTAEFCAYWYGDTIRAEAMQKEKQIKRLVLAVAKERERERLRKVNQTKVIKETKTIHKADGSVLKETRTRVVSTLIEMTDLWLPKLAGWIRTTLDLGHSDPEKSLAKMSTTKINTTATNSSSTEYIPGRVSSSTTLAPGKSTTTAAPKGSGSKTRSTRRAGKATGATGKARSTRGPKSSVRERREVDDAGFSTPFDNPATYADIDDPIQLAASVEMQRKAFDSYPILTGELRRRRQAANNGNYDKDDDDDGDDTAAIFFGDADNSTTTAAPAAPKTGSKEMDKALKNGGNLVPTLSDPSAKPEVAKRVITTTARPLTTSTRAPKPTKEPTFEVRISDASNKCALDGLSLLLSVAYDQNSLMYETNSISKDDPYIKAFEDSFKSVFARRWREKRDSWSKSMSEGVGKGLRQASAGRSVDEEIADSFEAHGGAYERGARLGFTIGKFIGDKSANQWPDPAELNTFTYDSLFLAGIGHGYSEEDSKQLERRIVAETAKRVAFSEANRMAFAKTLHSAYLNGAYIVPVWGVLHAQRAVAKQVAKEGSKAGFEAASKAAAEFLPKATKFFQMHRQQRRLAAPYKAQRRLSDKWAGLSEEISEVQFESELNRNISTAAIECGQKSGTLMGAVMGLVVAPESFETYTRFRGSLEALENEFNQFKLGAMRAYELGETWALLNYTATMNKNLQTMKTRMGLQPDGGNKTARAMQLATSTTQKPTSDSVKANLTSTYAKKAEKEESSSLFESKTGHSNANASDANGMDADKNTNNIFQYMILNYGPYLVANHSRRHMLKIRNMFMDENLLRDMKIQSGDLIANPEQAQLGLSSPGASTSETSIDDSDPFEPGPYAGELRGEFNSLKDEAKKRPIKFDILDLGPLLEYADEMKKQEAGSNKTSHAGKNKTQQVQLEETPLTADLARIGKVFLKMSVARRKKTRQLGGPDEVAEYLNGGSKFDQGDGYMAGTFSAILSHLTNATGAGNSDSDQPMPMVQDDFGLEAQILDELFERIEKTPSDMGSVSMVQRAFSGMTTMAPKKVGAIGEKKLNGTAATSTLRPLNATTFSPLTGIARSLPSNSTAKNSTREASAEDDGDDDDGDAESE